MSLEFTEKELAAIRQQFCAGFTDSEFDVAMAFCRLRNLLPGKHVIFQKRKAKEWDEVAVAKVEVVKIVFITTIDASRLIAQRTGKYAGQSPEEYIYLSEDGIPEVVSTIPLPQLPLPAKGLQALPREPWAVRTTVYHKDFPQPIVSVARFDAYASTYKGKDGPVLTEMWARRGPEQLAKCSEMLSLRKAFPEELGSLYIAEEFKSETEEPTTPVSPAVAVPTLPSAPPVNQQPAVVATDAPRPGEKTWDRPDGGKMTEAEIKATEKKIREALPALEEFLATPEAQAELAAKGLKVNQPEIDRLKKDVGLKPASELPAPAKKKGGRPKKESPINGQIPGEITAADIPQPGEVLPPVQKDPEAAAEFVESLDPTPTADEKKEFGIRIRALSAAGAQNDHLKNYILNVGGVDETSKLTVGNWKRALGELEAALAEGKEKLKEITKNAPLPKF